MEVNVDLIRAERILIKKGHSNHAACKRYCGAARIIYNAALYQMRQALFAETPISASQADKILKRESEIKISSSNPQMYFSIKEL